MIHQLSQCPYCRSTVAADLADDGRLVHNPDGLNQRPCSHLFYVSGMAYVGLLVEEWDGQERFQPGAGLLTGLVEWQCAELAARDIDPWGLTDMFGLTTDPWPSPDSDSFAVRVVADTVASKTGDGLVFRFEGVVVHVTRPVAMASAVNTLYRGVA